MKHNVVDRPIFVVGCPRSGTSMMQWALRTHPNLWGSAESDFLLPLLDGANSAYKVGTARGKLHWLPRQWVSREEFLGWIGVGINAMYTNRSNGQTWVEQTPQYTLHLADLAMMFPGTRFVGMIRDGRDVVASLRNFVAPMSHGQACRTWVAHTEALLAHHADHPGTVLLARYEEVVANTETILGDLFRDLDETPSDEAVHFVRNEPPINSSFDTPVGDQPRWSDWTAAERAAFVEIAGELLVKLRYESDQTWVDLALPATAESH